MTPRYGHQPVLMNLVSGFEDIKQAGDFYFEERLGITRIVLALPRSTEASKQYVINNLPVYSEDNVSPPVWKWDGNKEFPTLEPSIDCVGHWHGFVRNGEMVEAYLFNILSKLIL